MKRPFEPYLHNQKPSEILYKEQVKEVKTYYDGEIITESDTEVTRVSLSYNYDEGFDEYSEPSIYCQFITYTREKYTNLKYARELAKYEKDKAKYEKAMVKYKNDMLTYEALQKKKQEKIKENREMLERKQYIALKEKFEKLSKKFEDTK